jgi:hypothetical protein
MMKSEIWTLRNLLLPMIARFTMMILYEYTCMQTYMPLLWRLVTFISLSVRPVDFVMEENYFHG